MSNTKIAVIGWGSLIWDRRDLKLSSDWYKDGPSLPVEYLRISEDGRLTLVITDGVDKFPTLWALSNFTDIKQAIDNLWKREGKPYKEHIGSITADESCDCPIQKSIKEWIDKHRLYAAVWTALPHKVKKNGDKIMTPQEAVKYITSIQKNIKKWTTAEMYVRNTPEQINTIIRQQLREKFGWTDSQFAKL